MDKKPSTNGKQIDLPSTSQKEPQNQNSKKGVQAGYTKPISVNNGEVHRTHSYRQKGFDDNSYDA